MASPRPRSAPLAHPLTLDTEQALGAGLEARIAHALPTAHAVTVFAVFEASQSRPHELHPSSLGVTVGLQHLLLLDGVDTRYAAHGGLIQLDRLRGLRRRVECSSNLSLQDFEVPAKIGELVGGEIHGSANGHPGEHLFRAGIRPPEQSFTNPLTAATRVRPMLDFPDRTTAP